MKLLRAFRDDGTGDTVVVFTDYLEIIDKGSGRMERVEAQKIVQTLDGEKCDVIAESIDELKVRTVDTNRVLICHPSGVGASRLSVTPSNTFGAGRRHEPHRRD